MRANLSPFVPNDLGWQRERLVADEFPQHSANFPRDLRTQDLDLVTAPNPIQTLLGSRNFKFSFLVVCQLIHRPRRGAGDPRHEHVRVPLDLVEAVDSLLPVILNAEGELLRGPGKGEAEASGCTKWCTCVL